MEGPLSFASGPERSALELGSPNGLQPCDGLSAQL